MPSVKPGEAALLALLRRALFASEDLADSITPGTDWKAVFTEARQQTVLPLAVEAASLLPEEIKPPDVAFSRAFNQVILQLAENERIMAAQDDLVKVLNQSGVPYAILKGSSVAALYPKPELRVQGDIDVLINEKDYKRALEALSLKGYQHTPRNPSYDEMFYKDSVKIEIHKAISDLPSGEVGDLIRTKLSSALVGVRNDVMDGHAFPVLQDRYQMLSLILHMRFHMLGTGLGLRQLCDYALFLYHVDRNTWNADIEPMLRRFGLFRFAAILAKTCVCDRGRFFDD